MPYLLVKLTAIATIHVVIAVYCYYQRTTHQSPLWESDIVVFAIPSFLAFCGYFAALWMCDGLPFRPGTRIVVIMLLSIGATVLSTLLAMIFAFSRFGT
jgi:hypothetical protein